MALHGVDGAFLQRFAGQCEIKPGNHGIRDLRDEIGDAVRQAAEAEGRVYAIMSVFILDLFFCSISLIPVVVCA